MKTREIDRAVEYQQRQIAIGASEYSPTDKEAISRFMNKKQAEMLSHRRLTKLVGHFIKIKPFIENKDLVSLSKDEVVELVNKINEFKGWSEWTRHDYLVCLKMFYDYIDDSNIRSKLFNIRTPQDEDVDEDSILSTEEINQLVAATYNSRLKTIVQFLYDSGARVNELLKMNIANQKIEDDGTLTFDLQGTKNRYAKRKITVECSDQALNLFRAYLEDHPFKNDPSSPLWLTFHNERMGDRNLSELLRGLAKRAGITKAVNPHWFRDSKATPFIDKYGLEAARLYFGWSKTSDTPAKYYHSKHKALKKMILEKKPLAKDAIVDSLSFEVAKLVFSDEQLLRRLYERLKDVGKLDLVKALETPLPRGASKIYRAPWSGKEEILGAPKKKRKTNSSETP